MTLPGPCSREVHNLAIDQVSADRQKSAETDSPDAPAAEIPCFQCRGPGLDPWSGN